MNLQSLSQQGPPRNPNSRPQAENPSTAALHSPAITTSFKKQISNTKKKKKKKKYWKQRSANKASELERVRDSNLEWPVNPTTSPPASVGWPEMKPPTRPRQVSVEEQTKLLAMQVQHKGLQSCREFFYESIDEESDEDKEEEELGEVDYLTEKVRLAEGEVYKFLLQMFINDDKLRGYYEKNYESGDFCCLVCFGIEEKVNKRYKGCVGLVQHSLAISKAKGKRAHRAFGQVVCKVLGWDIDRLPAIVLKGEPLGKSFPNSSVTQDEAAKKNECNAEHMTVAEDNEGSKSGNNCKVTEKEGTDVSQNEGELMICENSLKVDVVNNSLENPDSKFLNMEADKDVVDCQGSDPSLITSTGWSCIKPVDKNSSPTSEWPVWKTQRPSVVCLAPAQERAQLSAVQFEQKVLEACREFFEKGTGSSSDDEDEGDLMDEDSEEVKFFLKVFIENTELRSYYEKNYEGGEFCCLVCGGIGKKVWKKFKDCIGLLQHSTAILNTKKMRAHRAFGQVICKVLGWDIDRLPTIVLKGEPLGQSLAKLGVSQVEADTTADGNKDDLSGHINNANCELARKENSDFHPNNGTVIASEGSPNKDYANKDVNLVHNGTLDMKGSNEGETDTSVPREQAVIAN